MLEVSILLRDRYTRYNVKINDTKDSWARDAFRVGRTSVDVTQGQTKTSRRVQPGVQDDGPDCKMATRGIIVRTRDLPSAALSPSQRAVEVAMATDRRKPAPTLLFPRMRAVGFAVSRSLCVKWFCCAVLLLPPRCSSFFSLRIPFPLCFFAVVVRRLFVRLFRASNVAASRCARWSRLSRFFPLATEFPMNKRTNDTLICDIVIGLLRWL